MPSAFIWSERSYPAMLLAEQPVHQRFVRLGPLVLESTLLKSPTPTADRDRTVSRRSEPRSRTALMGEQPNPWDLLQPQDATIRHRAYIPSFLTAQTISSPCSYERGRRRVIELVDLSPMSQETMHSISSFELRMSQSLRGHDERLLRAGAGLPTVLSSTRSTGRWEFTVISRFRLMMFPSPHPYVEVPNLPVDVDSWGR
jgi:hypothetical protein